MSTPPRRFRVPRTLGAKFLWLTAGQSVLMLALFAVAYLAMERLGRGQQALAATLPKAAAVAQVLHDSDVLRVIHVSLIGAGRNPDYVEKRLKRLAEVEAQLGRSLQQMEAGTWTPAEAVEVRRVVDGMRRYQAAFSPLMARARVAQADDLPELIEANTAFRREAYNLLLEMLPRLQREGEARVAQDGRAVARDRALMVLGLGLALVLGAAIARGVSRAARRQVAGLKTSMASLRHGDLTAACPVLSADELGQMAEDLNTVRHQLRLDMQAIAGIAEQTASGATELAATTEELSGATDEISQGAEVQRVAVDRASLAMGTLEEAAIEVQGAVAQAADLAQAGLRAGAQGTRYVGASVQAMGGILESSERVARITGVIADIARQTNLLALNAAIEAAKAGEHGLGFSVVAEEIRKLAERSAAAAKEISQVIQEAGDRAREGNRAVEVVRGSLTDLEAQVRDLAQVLARIQTARERQGQAGAELGGMLSETTGLTARNASATTELAVSIGETSRTVEDLARLALELRHRVQRFRLA